MEQTVNQFTKGLQMDTNPMIQGSDTLTDALNATLVTMNGNEVILQNDMGNRRVDNAFLPPGYEPVGMKEYGGVIYVASYNPVTHRSQIGSFPSPERKIDVNNPSPDQTNNNIFTFSKDSNGYLLETTKLIPLTEDKVLHAGDKFMIYGQNLDSSEITNWDNADDNDKKAISPKNRKYTLSIGVLNSQNEFVDITKDLVRVDPNKKIGNDNNPNYGKILLFDENDSEIYKFNRGYFLKNNAEDNDTFTNTISDNNLILERQRLEANTYSYKLVGPLYLKVQYNIPTTFNYNIYGVKNTNNTEITIEGYFIYNCPDGVSSSLNTGNENYKTFDTGQINLNGIFCDFDFDSSITPTLVNGSVVLGDCSYDPVSNLYSVKLTKTYTISQTRGLIYYSIKVGKTTNGSEEYIKSLSIENETLDLTKLNSGEVELTAWRFFNDFENQNTVLTYSFKAYPRYGEQYGNLIFQFKDINDTSIGENYILSLIRNVSILSTDSNWEEYEGYDVDNNNKIDINDYNSLTDSIDKNAVKELLLNKYIQEKVNTTSIPSSSNEFYDHDYDTNNDGKINISDYNNNETTNQHILELIAGYIQNQVNTNINNSYNIFVTTNLINGRNTITFNWDEYGFKPRKVYKVSYMYFSNSSPQGVFNYNNRWFITTELYNNHYSEEFWDDYCYDKKLINNENPTGFRKIELNIPIEINKINIDNSKPLSPKYNGSLINNSQSIEFSCKYTYKLDISDNSEYQIQDINLYPDFIELRSNIYPIINKVSIYKVGNDLVNNNVILLFDKNVEQYKTNESISNLQNFLSNPLIKFSDRSIQGELIYYDKYKSVGEKIQELDNVFVKISDVIDILFKINNNSACGIYGDACAEDGSRDEHYMHVFSGVDINHNIRNSQFCITSKNPTNNSDLPEGAHRIAQRSHDGSVVFKVKDYEDQIFSYFDNALNKDQIITYMFPKIPTTEQSNDPTNPDCLEYLTNKSDRTKINSSDKKIGEYSRFWWRNNIGGWSLVPQSMSQIQYNVISPISENFQDSNINNDESILENIINLTYSSQIQIVNSSYISVFGRFNSHGNDEDENLFPTCTVNNNVMSIHYANVENGISHQTEYRPEYIYIIMQAGAIQSGNILNSKITIAYDIISSKWGIETCKSSTASNFIFDNIFSKDYYYCAYNHYDAGSLSSLYKANKLNCIYNIVYSIPLDLKIEYKPNITTNSLLNQEIIPQTNTDFFNIEEQTSNNYKSYTIELKTGQDFRDKLDVDVVPSNILLNGKMLDKDGRKLNINYLYYEENGELIKKTTNQLFIDRENTKYTDDNQQLNILLYNQKTSGSPNERYNAVWKDNKHSFTLLDFSGLNIVEKI